MEKRKILYVIDGNSLLFRAYYATAYGGSDSIMRTKTGIPTNAIFAFSNMMTKILSSFKGGESIFVGFDTDSRTFRKEEFEDYKANRAACPEELIEQFPISREFLDVLGFVHYEEHGIEADDICGTIAKMASKQGYQVEVYTSDKDYLQLIDDNITINLLKQGLSNVQRMDEKAMLEDPKFGYKPLQIIDFKGLRGDASDNLPGIPGIGDKGAVKLIQQYGSFDAIIQAAKDGLIKGKQAENLIAGEEMGRKCYHLATILTDAKLPFTLEDLVYQGYDLDKASAFAHKYELKQFLQRLPATLAKGADKAKEIEVQTIHSFDGLEIPSSIGLALDLDESAYHDAPVEGIAISFGEKSFYEPIEDALKDERLKTILLDESIKKEVYDAKLVEVGLHRVGLAIKGIENDILLISYLLDSATKANPESVFLSFGVDIRDEESKLSLLTMGHPKRTGNTAYYSIALLDKALGSLRSYDAESLYHDIEFPLSHVLAKMEIEGFPIDKEVLLSFGEECRKKMKAAEEEVYALAGHKFNIGSPKQVATVLYDELGLGNGKEKSTAVDVLKNLDHPIVTKILEYRKYAKLVSTYVEGFIPHIKSDNKIHTCFNQAETTTGRLSSSSPNLQNISARDEEAKKIREAFYYPNHEYKILSLDYGQIELRILAALSHCDPYIEVFREGRDVHTETAKKIFQTEEVTPLMRRRAKAVNFAIIYGTTPFGLADQIEGTPAEAKQIITNFYRSYPEIGNYLDSIIEEVEHNGFVKTMFGRRRYLRDITDPNYAKREAAKRQALNAPVQGSAADLIKIAMLHIDRFLEEGGYKTKMVLQIHDELLFKVPAEEEWIAKKLQDLMVNAVTLPVKLTAEGSLGETWYDAKD